MPLYFNPRSPRGERPMMIPSCQKSITISIHAPRVGSDVKRANTAGQLSAFQSTLPAWGATIIAVTKLIATINFNPRSPRGERPRTSGLHHQPQISIHAPRVGSDLPWMLCESAAMRFQSTLPAWGATTFGPNAPNTPPRFQSTLPAWGATSPDAWGYVDKIISIHAPRVGSDEKHGKALR